MDVLGHAPKIIDKFFKQLYALSWETNILKNFAASV